MDEFIFDPFHRRSIRLKDYDYSQPGGYFVTIASYERETLFGKIDKETMVLNSFGVIVQRCWNDLKKHYSNIDLDSFIVMPNHIHGVITIKDSNIDPNQKSRAGHRPAPTKNHSLSEIVRAFKSYSSNKINTLRHMTGVPVWQRNYYEHIIRDDEELNSIREYIENNPQNWDMDKENLENQ